MAQSDLHVMSQPPFDPTDEVRMTDEVRAYRDPATSAPVLNHYIRGPSVGKGQHGEVYLCWDMNRGYAEVAMKVVPRKNHRQDRLSKLKRRNIPASGPHLPVTDNLSSQEYKIRKEIAIMKQCRHPHVVRLLEVIDDKLYKKVYMVMEYLGGGEVKWRSQTNRPVLRVDQSRRICRDVILGLEYLHCQGIIHRDIKPANLMWTEDRRTVKITDFGVAHISAAQRLAASGNDPAPELTHLFDDSELCKTAGTPSFLAPEVVYDFGNTDLTAASSNGSSVNASDAQGSMATVLPTQHRPPITKAIDVWALGVTLYSLLFGQTPFRAEGNHEFVLYQVICTQDWDVPATMGLDEIPTGGRHPSSRCTRDPSLAEGAMVISLLSRLLDKNASTRITLDDVKRHRWFLRDIPNADQWVKETVPDNKVVVSVTEAAISTAVSPVRFRWSKVLTNRISTFFRTVRPQRSFRSVGDRSDDDVGVHSAPSASMGRHAKRSGSYRATTHRPRRVPTRQRGKPKEKERPSASRRGSYNRSAVDLSTQRGKSDIVPLSPASASSGAVDSTARPSAKLHRGSATLLAPPNASVRSFSPTSSTGGDDSVERPMSRDRPKSRFSLSSLKQWRVGRSVTYGPGPQEASTSTTTVVSSPSRKNSSGQTSTSLGMFDRPSRLSDEASPTSGGYQHHPFSPVSNPMRASSWGDVGEYGRQAVDITSVHSGDREEALDDDILFFGAGGVATTPLPPTPSGAIGVSGPPVPHFSGLDAVCVGAVSEGPALKAVPPELLHPVTGRDPASQPDPAMHDPAFSRHSSRTYAPSPLVQLTYSSGDDDLDDDDDSSFFERNSEDISGERPTASEIFGDDDDTESDEEAVVPIEVRRRRPSWSVVGEQPPESDEEEEEGGSALYH